MRPPGMLPSGPPAIEPDAVVIDGEEIPYDPIPAESATAEQVRNLNAAIRRNLLAFDPPDDLTVSEWAERKRRLSTEASAEPGPWRNYRTPYLVEVMDSFNDPRVRHITMVAASQIGKSECINNIIGYIIDEDPGSILFVQPTNIDAKEYSRLRIAPMIRDTPCLRRRIRDARQKDSGNTILQKAFPGGVLTLCGSNEAHALASKPIRYVLGDELDRWSLSAGAEGNPWDLAMARQKTFYNAKSMAVSTPTVQGASPIAKHYAEGTMEHWKSQCPHCGEFNGISWNDIRYEHDEYLVNGEKVYQVRSVLYVCPSCGAVSDEAAMKAAPAKWMADNPDAIRTGHRSFWLNAFVSKWESWEDIVLKWLHAQGDPLKMQVVYNTCFGLLWENRGDLATEDGLLARREDYPAELPDGVLVLTAGVDTQDDRLEYEIVGHGHFGETWHLEYGQIMGRPDSDEVWQTLDDVVLKRVMRFSDGTPLKVTRTFIDEGGHFTQEVRRRCRLRQAMGAFDIKGIYGPDRPYTDRPKEMQVIDTSKRTIGKVWQYQLGVDSGKAVIMDALKVGKPGNGFHHFPRSDRYSRDYFASLLSEHLVYNEKNIKAPWKWEKLPGHKRNEALDVLNYAMAAFKSLPVNLDEVDRRLKVARGRPAELKELPGQAPEPKQAPRPRPRRRRRMQEDW